MQINPFSYNQFVNLVKQVWKTEKINKIKIKVWKTHSVNDMISDIAMI